MLWHNVTCDNSTLINHCTQDDRSQEPANRTVPLAWCHHNASNQMSGAPSHWQQPVWCKPYAYALPPVPTHPGPAAQRSSTCPAASLKHESPHKPCGAACLDARTHGAMLSLQLKRLLIMPSCFTRAQPLHTRGGCRVCRARPQQAVWGTGCRQQSCRHRPFGRWRGRSPGCRPG